MMNSDKITNGLKKYLYHWLGKIDIPKELLDREYPIVVHITDTPTAIYGEIDYLLKKLKPEYIIHTGDLVDNIKLELSPKKIDLYEKFVKKMMLIISKTVVHRAWVCMGNHDCKEVIMDFDNIIISESLSKIEINGIEFCISHYGIETRECHADYHLFGHDMLIESSVYHDECYLNGLESINIINLENRQVWKLDYPNGTDDYRLNKYKIGI